MSKKFRLYPDDQLENKEIREKLLTKKRGQGYTPSSDLVNSILQVFWFRDWNNSFISFTPYFELLDTYLFEKRPSEFNRPSFYSYVFQKIVGPRSSKRYGDLQKLALAFEQGHTDRILVGDYTKLLKRLSLSSVFLRLASLEKKAIVYVATEKDGTKLVVWKHHTLTEYLTADYILRSSNPLKQAKDLMLLSFGDTLAIKHSWYGTLRFILESNQAELFVKWLVELGNQDNSNVDDDFSQTLLSVDPAKLSRKLKSQVFSLIYDLYQKELLWLPVYTRNYIANFIQQSNFDQLKFDIQATPNQYETYIHRGNVVAIIDSLLEKASPLLMSPEKLFWKNRLVEYANNDDENGVLQRHALGALGNYKDTSLISKVSKTFNHKDSLVREAFIQFCYTIDPNLSESVDYMVQGIKTGITIYARHGIFKITDKNSLIRLINYFTTDNNLLKLFVDRESIFDDENEEGDHTLLSHIRNEIRQRDLLDALKKMIKTGFGEKDNYHLEKSSFIHQVAEMIIGQDPGFLFEILNQTKDIVDENERRHVFFGLNDLLPYLLSTDNVEQFFTVMSDYPVKRVDNEAELCVHDVVIERGVIGKKIFNYCRRKKLIQPWQPTKYTDSPELIYGPVYDRFKKMLRVGRGKYNPEVYEYYIRARKDIEKTWTTKDKQRLIKLALQVVSFDTSKITVTIPNKSLESKQFTWTSWASFYGDALRVLQILAPDKLTNYRQHIINFIPYAYSDDQMTIGEIIAKVKEKELKNIYSVLGDESNDARYLIPSGFIYLVGEFKKRGSNISRAKEILRSLVVDRLVSEYDRRSALEKYGLFVSNADQPSKVFLEHLFESYISTIPLDRFLAEIANQELIEIYRDPKAIEWRFAELERRAFPFDEQSRLMVHSVGPQEEELDTLEFALPLIRLNDPIYQDRFLKLLGRSFTILESDEDAYWAYSKYLWQIVISYFDLLVSLGSFNPYLHLWSWVEKNAKSDKTNWFKAKLSELRRSYINGIGKTSLT